MLEQTLCENFGWDGFRPLQREIIETVLGGKSALAVLPTGGGKSLCYQLPALLLPGVTLVVSPLISLMKDQVDGLVMRKIPALAINSQDTAWEMERKLADIQNGQVRLVYVAPERLKNGSFLDACRRACISLIAVDEAHCVSQWGHDFRPDYRFIQDFRREVKSPPLLALTATATRRVREDVVSHLGIADAERFVAGVDRPNLWLGVERCSTVAEKRGKVASLVDRAEGSTVVYVSSRREADELAVLLERTLNEPVAAYHAGLDLQARTSVQNRFMAGLVRVVTATNAFGMGIDKADIRAVIHAGVPESIEAYFQEIGRAGRDGHPAECTLVVVPGMDVKLREFLLEKDEPTRALVDAVVQNIKDALAHGEGVVPYDERDGALGTLILSQLQIMGYLELVQRTSIGMRVRGLRPLESVVPTAVWDHVQEHIRAKSELFRRVKRFVYLNPEVCRRGFLMQYFGDEQTQRLPTCCSACQPRPVTARRLAGMSRQGKPSRQPQRPSPSHAPDPDVLDRLKSWRWGKATERGVPAYVIFGDSDLEGIAGRIPTSLDELAACRGVGPTKLELYGDELLSILSEFAERRRQHEKRAWVLFERGESVSDVTTTLECEPENVWESFLAWVTEAENDAWKEQVRRFLRPEEYLAIRRELKKRRSTLSEALLVQLEERFSRQKIDLTRAVMTRMGESQE